MVTRSSILVWRIPWKEAPGGIQSIGSQTVRHGSSLACNLYLYMVFLLYSTISSKRDLCLSVYHSIANTAYCIEYIVLVAFTE